MMMHVKKLRAILCCGMIACAASLMGEFKFPFPARSNGGFEDGVLYEPYDYGKDVPPGAWAERQPGLFGIYNSLLGVDNNRYLPYVYEDLWTNAYPRIFYLNINRKDIADIDTLKYNWHDDVITSICHDTSFDLQNDLICETMMWSSRDTIFTYGNHISKRSHGTDIGNSLYNRALIEEIGYRDTDTLRFRNEISGIYRLRFVPIYNYYCKIRIKNGKIVSYFFHHGSITKQQYRALPEEEKKRVK